MTAIDVKPFIGGRERNLAPAFEQPNPANLDDVVSRLPNTPSELVDEAVACARSALPALDASVEARADALERIGAAVAAQAPDLAALIARETGKTISDARGEVLRASRLFRFFGGESLRIVGEKFASTRPGVSVEVTYEPVGVVGAITPWNFPIAIPAWKIGPAVAYGNAVVWKPSEHSSAVALALLEIINVAGLPAGAVNMAPGAGETGAAVAAAPGIDAVSFTGSERTGGLVRQAASARGARVQTEMGGVNGLIVLADANLDAAVEIIVNGAFFAAGQRCTATSRVIVQRAIAKSLVEKLKDRMSTLKLGDPMDPSVEIGPLVSTRQKNDVNAGISTMKAAGRSWLGGARGSEAPACYVDPILFEDIQAGDLIAREEIFGPVAGLILVDNYEAALETMNAPRFGLCGGLCTSSLKHAEHFKRHARVGMAMINLPTAGVDYHAPFGGVGASSYGSREQGRAAREFYTLTKTAYQKPA